MGSQVITISSELSLLCAKNMNHRLSPSLAA